MFSSKVLKHYFEKTCVTKLIKLQNIISKQFKNNLPEHFSNQKVTVLLFDHFSVTIDFFETECSNSM